MKRFSCEQCAYDLCEECFTQAPVAGADQDNLVATMREQQRARRQSGRTPKDTLSSTMMSVDQKERMAERAHLAPDQSLEEPPMHQRGAPENQRSRSVERARSVENPDVAIERELIAERAQLAEPVQQVTRDLSPDPAAKENHPEVRAASPSRFKFPTVPLQGAALLQTRPRPLQSGGQVETADCLIPLGMSPGQNFQVFAFGLDIRVEVPKDGCPGKWVRLRHAEGKVTTELTPAPVP